MLFPALCKSTSHNQYPGVFPFDSNDNTENFVFKNKKVADWEWLDKKVSYTLNSQGYRAKEFEDCDWKNSVLFFGCSWVYGVGVDDSDTMTYMFTAQTGIPCINLGMPAVSNWFTVKNCEILNSNNINPKAVVNCMTYPTRTTLFHDDDTQTHIGKWSTEENKTIFEKLSTDHNTSNYYAKWQKQLIDSYFDCPVLHYSVDELIATHLKIPFLIDIVGKEYFWDIKNRARDTAHQGPTVNHKIIKHIVNDFNSKIR